MRDISFEQIYRDYFRDVFLYIKGLCHDDGIAEEIAQESFAKALKSIDSFDGKKDIRAWLFTIAKNTYFTYCRRKHLSLSELPEIPAEDVRLTQRIENEEQAMAVHKLLHNMDEPYKEVFNLRVFGELSFDKIGVIFGKSSGWARVVYFRAKKKITDELEALGYENNL